MEDWAAVSIAYSGLYAHLGHSSIGTGQGGRLHAERPQYSLWLLALEEVLQQSDARQWGAETAPVNLVPATLIQNDGPPPTLAPGWQGSEAKPTSLPWDRVPSCPVRV